MHLLRSASWEYVLAAVIACYYLWYSVSGGSELSLSPELANRLKVTRFQELDTSMINTSQKLGYIQYATTPEYLNLAIMNLARIKQSDTLATGLIVVYSRELEKHPKFRRLAQLAHKHSIELRPIQTIDLADAESDIWKSSFTKFQIFNQVDYDKLIYFDADSMLVHYPDSDEKVNIDELFCISDSIDIAMPRAYWLFSNQNFRKIKSQPVVNDSLLFDEDKFGHRIDFFANHVIVLKPGSTIFANLMKYVNNPWYWHIWYRNRLRKSSDYDMEIMNRFADDQLKEANGLKFGILDHTVYGVITGELPAQEHSKFLSDPRLLPLVGTTKTDEWDANKVMRRLKLVHFSDDPVPKPWMEQDDDAHYNTYKIVCSKRLDRDKFNSMYPINKPKIIDDCATVDSWNWIRNEFYRLQKQFWVL